MQLLKRLQLCLDAAREEWRTKDRYELWKAKTKYPEMQSAIAAYEALPPTPRGFVHEFMEEQHRHGASASTIEVKEFIGAISALTRTDQAELVTLALKYNPKLAATRPFQKWLQAGITT